MNFYEKHVTDVQTLDTMSKLRDIKKATAINAR